MDKERADLERMFRAGVAAVNPETLIDAHIIVRNTVALCFVVVIPTKPPGKGRGTHHRGRGHCRDSTCACGGVWEGCGWAWTRTCITCWTSGAFVHIVHTRPCSAQPPHPTRHAPHPGYPGMHSTVRSGLYVFYVSDCVCELCM